MLNRFSKFRALTWRYKIVAVRAFVELPLLAVFFDRLSPEWFSGDADIRTADSVHNETPATATNTAFQLARIVNAVAAVLPIHARCLVRSVYLCQLLRRRGIHCRLVVGVQHDVKGQFAAHAWVEREGTPINDASDIAERFTPLDVHGRTISRDGQPRFIG